MKPEFAHYWQYITLPISIHLKLQLPVRSYLKSMKTIRKNAFKNQN